MSSRDFVLRTWKFLYPPYELSMHGPTDVSQEEGPTAASFQSKKSVASDVQQTHLAIAESIYKSEIERKKGLEDKATTFLTGVAISSSILLALPALLTERINGPLYLKMIVLVIFIIAVGYLIVAAVYAIKVRARAAHYVINSSSLQTFALTAPDFRRKWALHLIDLVRRNEPLLTLKANQLYLSEKTFLRGVIVAIFGSFLLVIFSVAYPKMQMDQLPTISNLDKGEFAILTNSLSRCVNVNTDLNTQLSAEVKAKGELNAELTASRKAQASLNAKLEAKRKPPMRNTPRPTSSVPMKLNSQKCVPDPALNERPTPDKFDSRLS